MALAGRDLQAAVTSLSSSGAEVVLLTAPYYKLCCPMKIDQERSPVNEAWVARYNQVQVDVAHRNPTRVRIMDLNKFLDPEGTWTATVDGVAVRTFDRSHLSDGVPTWPRAGSSRSCSTCGVPRAPTRRLRAWSQRPARGRRARRCRTRRPSSRSAAQSRSRPEPTVRCLRCAATVNNDDIWLAILLVSLAGLLLEVGYTRIVSYKLWYYYTYLVIGLALLGIGSGGVFVAVCTPCGAGAPTASSRLLAMLGAVSIAIGYLVVARSTSTRSRSGTTGPRASFTNLPSLGVICFAIFATFIAFGVIVSVLLGRARRRRRPHVLRRPPRRRARLPARDPADHPARAAPR